MSIHRRHFLQAASGLATSLFLPCAGAAFAAPRVVDTKVISKRDDLYHGWPTLSRRESGQLLLVCSGGRQAHVCPFGRVELMRSDDDGQSWSWPQVLLDSPIDDRDAGVLETSKGTLLATTFTSLAYVPILEKAIKADNDAASAWPAEKLDAWKAAHRRATPQQRQAALGVWMTRSTDGGVTWSGRYDCRINSPHGPIQLSDGRLLYAGKDLWREGARVGVCESKDDGKTWSWLSEIEPRPGDSHRSYHELHAVEAPSGRIVVHIRNHNSANARETLQCVSDDGGKTWTQPASIGVWGLPSHLLRLRDGRLLMSYGHRRPPYGNQARVSDDEGETWSDPIIISGDGAGGDLGYPSTVELGDGSLLTVWYEKMSGSAASVLRQAKWTLG